MRILWLCNIVLPDIAHRLHLKASNKEGWLSGVCNAVKESRDFELAICFPVPREYDGFSEISDGIEYFGFYEDTAHPETYDAGLEDRIKRIIDAYNPDMVHIFGTEYPHTLAACRVMKDRPERILVGVQGVMDVYTEHFCDGVPKRVIDRVTFRDFLKNDSILKQKEKYAKRSVFEDESAQIAGNITGRTPFDLDFAVRKHPEAKYHFLNETLRSDFYEGKWDLGNIENHSIFLSQGNYPIKGLHYMLEAMPSILESFPDAKVYVAGDNVTKHSTFKEKLKLSSYGKYLLELINENDLTDKVIFLGGLSGAEIKERLLQSNLFICPSTIENSPNSLGEAMILGVPCIAAKVGGIEGIFKSEVDGIMFERGDIEGLSNAVKRMWSDESLMLSFSENASMHAHVTHNPEINYKRLLEIYREITECK